MFGSKLRRKGSNNGSSALPGRAPEGPGRRDKHYRNGNHQLIECRRLVKTYHSPAGDFPALKEIDKNNADPPATISGKGRPKFPEPTSSTDNTTPAYPNIPGAGGFWVSLGPGLHRHHWGKWGQSHQSA